MSTSVEFTFPKGMSGKYYDFLTNENYTEMAFLGGFGTAKTDCLVTSIIRDCLEYPGSVMLLARNQLATLKRTTLPDLLRKAGNLVVNHNKTDSVIYFPEVKDHEGNVKQSIVYCMGLETGDYVQKLKSLQPFRIYIDEADKIPEEVVNMCVLRMRQKVYHRETGKPGKNQIKLVANDEGNNWLWRRFVGKPHPGKNNSPEWVEENVGIREIRLNPQVPEDVWPGDIAEYGRNRYFVSEVTDDGDVYLKGKEEPTRFDRIVVVGQRYCVYAFAFENKSLNQQAIRNARFVSGAMRDKYVFGRVDTQEGLLFPEFDPQVGIIEVQEILYETRIVVGIDVGFDHPTAAVALARTDDGRVIVVEEYEQRGFSSVENAHEIKDMVANYERVRFFGDPSMWNTDPRMPGESVARDYQRAGINPLRKANRNRELSIDRIKNYLRPEITYQNPEGMPKLLVQENCQRTIHMLGSIRWEDFKRKRNDDLLDALRYAVMSVYDADMVFRSEDVQVRPFTV